MMNDWMKGLKVLDDFFEKDPEGRTAKICTTQLTELNWTEPVIYELLQRYSCFYTQHKEL